MVFTATMAALWWSRFAELNQRGCSKQASGSSQAIGAFTGIFFLVSSSFLLAGSQQAEGAGVHILGVNAVSAKLSSNLYRDFPLLPQEKVRRPRDQPKCLGLAAVHYPTSWKSTF